MNNNIYIYLLVAALTIFAVRALPMTLIRKDINNRFLRSFLYYVPYVTLSVMTFPAIISSTGSTASGIAGFLTGLILAYLDGNLFRVAIGSCLSVAVVEVVTLLLQ